MLTAHHLYKSFNDTFAVRNVSLALESGQIMALVGASGSGKSTLLNLLAGLMDPDEGEVRLNDVHVATPNEKLVPGHPDIRLVHQEYQLMPNITVRENIAYAVRYYQKAYQTYRVNELLRLCRLEAVADRIPRRISGGEKQRTAIARAIAEPSADGRTVVLLLDEPFSHLDLPNRTHIRDLLLDLVRETEPDEPASFACLFVTHDATDALALSDTVGVMENGEIIQLGSPQVVYGQPRTAYVARMTGPANIIPGKWLPTLRLPATTDPEQLVCIRPEAIEVSAAGVPVTVRAVLFRGGYTELLADAGEGLPLQLFTTDPAVSVGQQLFIAVKPEQVRELPVYLQA
ncbi:ABC transporter ATP-binding protein [Arsenicibacter rosenii]|uniref:Fe3+/spermidine/putrescine ABC transporter ATP-binding protein n=1 Tax=Arsenicibacter rosenii TaxID=1750698 RepID=A0A1S2VKX0_9BACT|nr:ABC transporter ATP-binding protein [Arsenicibacter rosenii]OIN59403.1 Fe3+/spermidine/putrescine ABC transporter ATP-binding protein [Arsenicibacter rosenii]